MLCTTVFVTLVFSGLQVSGQPPSSFPVHHETPSWSSTGLIAYRDDGIVYVDESSFFFTSDSLKGIWILNPETGDKWRVLAGQFFLPDWSPDGTQLVVSTGQIYTVSADGMDLRRLTLAGNNFFPAWSPDGEWIAFDSNYTLQTYAVWIMRTDGSERRVIGPTGARKPEWSPDGSVIVHIRGASEVTTMTREGNDIRSLITTGDLPEYSPDGQMIAYKHAGRIWVMNADGSEQRQVTTVLGGAPSWSPDGMKIVFSREETTRNAPELGVLWVVDLVTGVETQLTHKWPTQCPWPNCEDTPVEKKSISDVKSLYGGQRR